MSSIIKRAKKKHSCSVWDFIEMDLSQLETDSGYRCQGININDSYERQRVIGNDDIWTFKACLPCLDFVKKYEIDISGDC